MTKPPEPLFLARQGYRRRRLADVARLLPVLGVGLFMLPLLGAEEAGHTTAGGGLYLFAAWFVLILCAALLSRALGRGLGAGAAERGEDG